MGLPQLWPELRGYLSVLRLYHPSRSQAGCLVDLFHQFNLPGYTATVWLLDGYFLPRELPKLLLQPHEVFDTPEEISLAGWRVASP